MAALLLGGCSGVVEAPRSRSRAVPRSEASFLGSPLAGYPLLLGAFEERQVQEAHRLLLTGDHEEARSLALELLSTHPGLHPALIVLAQEDYLSGNYEAAARRISPVLDELPDYASARLIDGRVQEKLGNLLQAFASYRSASQFPVAVRRASELEARALEIAGNRLRDALDRGRVEDAAAALLDLQEWAPSQEATLRAGIEVAQALGDPKTELEASRLLSALAPDERELVERRAELELEVGSPSDGLRILQDLVALHPRDEALAEKLARARFRWRLILLPEAVGRLADLPELKRGDFAALVYWLFPTVRYGHPPGGRIANDVFQHPQREEIVRVVNMGLMEVDPALHRFEPDRRLSRRTALTGFLRILRGKEPALACLGEDLAFWPVSLDQVCRAASRCRLIGEAAECLPEASLSGSTAVEMTRKALEQLGIL